MITRLLAALVAAALSVTAILPRAAQAQAVVSSAAVRDSADPFEPPISPKRAFLYSLVVPGSAQNILGRNRAAVGIMAIELMSIVMIRESGFGVRQARQQRGDSLVLSYVDDNGNLLPVPELERRRFEDVEVRARRSHVEDWIALLIANHLFAAADGFVSASLWDVPARIGLEGNRSQLTLMARITW